MAGKDQITVVGAGMMGPGITTCAALAGHPVVIVYRSPASADRAIDAVRRKLSQLLEGKLVDRARADRAREIVLMPLDWIWRCPSRTGFCRGYSTIPLPPVDSRIWCKAATWVLKPAPASMTGK